MKVRNVGRRADEKVELMMTPMIDIVFQLLIFFIMTFKIVAPEGDFNIKMPLAAPSEGLPDDNQLPPIKITLRARADRDLDVIVFGERQWSGNAEGFARLHNEIREIVGDDSGPGSIADSTEVELDCDYQLKFDYVIKAISSVSGYIDPDTRRPVKVIEKIKFSPPRKKPAP